MAIRITLTGAALAVLATAGPLTGVAHAESDLDCADFVYQEDAQAQFDLDRTDPDRLDEDRGSDDGVACEALPRRDTAEVSVATPVITPLTTPSATPLVTPVPTLGVQGGSGGSVGPAGFERAIGVALALGGAGLAGAYVVRRRRATHARLRDR
ncbi:hypothetical protein M2164_002494 [Streptomyces sp. SAI-208]|uniref:hypothetical protein n=1 Tax=unclassified Streptomyces TaxID=2593676 RepID=UPI0024738145|nr:MULTISPECIES: hypothetical protein [unclassified Streptomyces]MDH6516031.1 hypothetical protein [Streptomyces sp. SAI-090]MDH6548245.1 hypothetical protein [Streptomyces sp. SAI-041]MDH6587730.1 hypothetical protein [Streptomyces sp. SAI-133]MDH6606859.1 hypothetical protein [Streptomyces sp. SAI-208]MDH6619883.1 hypothetical protein [Streptomyces sp. SAI-135]